MALNDQERIEMAKAANDNVTIIQLDDPKLIEQLEVGTVKDFIQFRDPKGRLILVVTQRLPGSPSPEMMTKVVMLTKEELAERRNQPGGKTTAEVLSGIKARHSFTK